MEIRVSQPLSQPETGTNPRALQDAEEASTENPSSFQSSFSMMLSSHMTQTLKQKHVIHTHVLKRGICLIDPDFVFLQGCVPLSLQSQVSPGSVPKLVGGLEGVLGTGWAGFLRQTLGL